MHKYIDMNKIQKSPKIKISDGLFSFSFNDTYIIDPTMDETGTYQVNGEEYYSLSKKNIKKMLKKTMPKIDKMWPEWRNK